VTWPEATVQTCVVHLVRNSLRYASKKHWQAITKQMRQIYTAPTVPAAESYFADFAQEWEQTYPAMIQSWRSAWEEFVPFLAFPAELRKVVYTTNAIESLNSRFRRAVRQRGHFPNDTAALKVLYLVATARQKNRENLTGRINSWKTILNTLSTHYGDRINSRIN
jgi:putative transposase